MASKKVEDLEASFSIRGRPEPTDHPAETLIRKVTDLVYYAQDGYWDGTPGHSPFAACLVLGVLTAAPEAKGNTPLEDLEPGEVALSTVACLHMRQHGPYAERTRGVLIKRLETIVADLKKGVV